MPATTTLANTTNPLGANAEFVGDAVRIDDPLSGSRGASIVDAMAILSGGGTMFLEVSKDGITWSAQETVILAAGVAGFVEELRLAGRFARARLLDGGAGSPSVVLHANLRTR